MNRSLRLSLLLLATLATLATACGGERPSGGDAAAPTTTSTMATTMAIAPIAPIAPSVAVPVPTVPGAPMDPLVEPEIHAQVRPTTVAAGASPTLLVTVKNHGKGFLFVPDPERGGDALQVHLTPPGGAEIVVSPGTVAGSNVGGVARPTLASAKVLPGETTTFDFELAALAPIAAPGRYVIVVDYAWSPGAPRWRSPALAFTVTPR